MRSLLSSLTLLAVLPASPIAVAQAISALPDAVTAKLAPTPSAVYPVQAELIASLSGSRLKAGETVMAKLLNEWTFRACTLPRGSAITGRVTDVSPWSNTSKRSTVSLLFEAPCGDATPISLTWIALLAPDNSDLAGLHSGNPVSIQSFRSSSFGESGGLGSSGINQSQQDMTGRQNPNAPVFLSSAPDRRIPRPTAVATGEVWRVPNLSLSVATGTLGSSVLSSSKRDLHVPVGAVLVLSAGLPSTAQPASSNVAGRPLLPEPRRPEPWAEPSLACPPSTCSSTHHAGLLPGRGSTPSQSIPLAGLGYHRLRSAEMRDFEFGAALTPLDPEHVLFTFNSHRLIPRVPGDDPRAHPRMVRAVLFNLQTAQAESILDWRVGDDRQYIWTLADGRILLHAAALPPADAAAPGSSSSYSGDHLLLLDPQLKEIASLPLASPLSFVRVSPNSAHIAVGLVHELHTPAVHATLSAANSNDPEEEITVLLLDGDLNPLGRDRQSSLAPAPVLTDSGRITLLHAGGEHWRYRETPWGSSVTEPGEARTVARISSSCIPELSSLAPDLTFITGCDTRTIDRWYRLLRSDGTSILKGALLSSDTQPFPIASPTTDLVAIALPSAHDGYVPGRTFHGADLSAESIRVYNRADGRVLLAADTPAPSPTRQPIAFLPGSRLAVLDGEHICIYSLPAAHDRPAALSAGR